MRDPGELVSLAGEFSTFSTSSRRPHEYPQYQHDDLALSFMPVMAALREALSMLIDSKATPIRIRLAIGLVLIVASFSLMTLWK